MRTRQPLPRPSEMGPSCRRYVPDRTTTQNTGQPAANATAIPSARILAQIHASRLGSAARPSSPPNRAQRVCRLAVRGEVTRWHSSQSRAACVRMPPLSLSPHVGILELIAYDLRAGERPNVRPLHLQAQFQVVTRRASDRTAAFTSIGRAEAGELVPHDSYCEGRPCNSAREAPQNLRHQQSFASLRALSSCQPAPVRRFPG